MNWIENVLRWRALPLEQKQRLRWEAIPADVVQSMAFEREPVSEALVRETLDRLRPLDFSKQPSES